MALGRDTDILIGMRVDILELEESIKKSQQKLKGLAGTAATQLRKALGKDQVNLKGMKEEFQKEWVRPMKEAKAAAKAQADEFKRMVAQRKAAYKDRVQGLGIKESLSPADYKRFQVNLQAITKEYGRTIAKNDRLNLALKRTQRQAKKARGEFQGWALSLMFFGMALKNTFSRIWQSSTQTFNDVMHSVEGTTTGFDMLTGSLQYLGFTVGAALEPFAAMLVPIIMAIADWVTQNEELVGWVIVLTGVFGFLLQIIGGGVLAVMGFIGAWGMISTYVVPVIQGLIGIVSGVSATVLAVIVAIIAVIVVMFATNFGKIRNITVNIFKAIWNFIKNVTKGLINIFKGLFNILKGLFTGDWDLILKGFIQILMGVLRIIASIGDTIVEIFFNVIALVSNMLVSGFLNIAKIVIGVIKTMIDTANLLPGVEISTAWATNAIDRLEGMKQAAMWVPESKGSLVDLVDKLEQWALADKKQVTNVYIDGTPLQEGVVTEMERSA